MRTIEKHVNEKETHHDNILSSVLVTRLGFFQIMFSPEHVKCKSVKFITYRAELLPMLAPFVVVYFYYAASMSLDKVMLGILGLTWGLWG